MLQHTLAWPVLACVLQGLGLAAPAPGGAGGTQPQRNSQVLGGTGNGNTDGSELVGSGSHHTATATATDAPKTGSVLLHKLLMRRFMARPFSVYHTLLIQNIHAMLAAAPPAAAAGVGGAQSQSQGLALGGHSSSLGTITTAGLPQLAGAGGGGQQCGGTIIAQCHENLQVGGGVRTICVAHLCMHMHGHAGLGCQQAPCAVRWRRCSSAAVQGPPASGRSLRLPPSHH